MYMMNHMHINMYVHVFVTCALRSSKTDLDDISSIYSWNYSFLAVHPMACPIV